ncbi:MAG: Ig-like domain-containing protein [Actinomycetota bacterium]|nr:Ig-like domain-containing protein [Actinomycetota bacterium]
MLPAMALAASIFMALAAFPATAAAAAPGPTTTTVTANPRISTQGDPVTYTAFVSAASGARAMTGTVAFTVGPSPLCVATVLLTANATSRAQCITTNTPDGLDTVTATYSGDPSSAGSVGTTTVRVNRPAAPLTPTTTRASADLSVRGRVIYTATVTARSGVAPHGKVTFTLMGQRVCTTEVQESTRTSKGTSQGSCDTVSPPPGNYTVTAAYAGDTGFAGSSGNVTFNVLPPKFGGGN